MIRPTVLIVDDDGDSRLAMKAALRKREYTFLEAEDGGEGVKVAVEKSPDLIIMDVMMPRINGYEALRRIREQDGTRQIPVLMITALGSMDEKIYALEAGADGLLPKPFDKNSLLNETDELLKGSPKERSFPGRTRWSSELIRYYYTDALTGTANRSQLIRDIRRDHFPGLILLDIDRFKDIVYFYGHRIADACLKAFVAKTEGILGSGGYRYYRVSGDIFAVLVPECFEQQELVMAMDILERAWLSAPYLECEGQWIPIRVTIGGSTGGEGLHYELLNRAEKALKTAKKQGRGRLLFNESETEFRSYEQNIFWSKKIREAINEGRVIPYFQPIINNGNGAVEKYECLVRLIEHDGSVTLPGEFLEVSKRTHHYAAITHSMIKGAMQHIEKSGCHFTINLSARDMIDPEISGMIYELLEDFPSCERVMFELLESEGVENYDAVYSFIERVKGYGCRIAIDDFGAGYSNFIHMIRLKVDVIKIDGSLIRDLDKDDNARSVVEAIVAFAKKMGVRTVAEFVHSEAVFEIVKTLGVDYSQGYYLGHPKESV